METRIEGMLTESRKREMVEQMKDHLGAFTHAEFARKMGISPQNAYSWLTRGAFNAELVALRCPEISGDWLLTGRGAMLREERMEEEAAERDPRDTALEVRRLVASIRDEQRLTAKAQEQADRLLDLLTVLSAALK